jgi:hypothetical protein
MRVVAMTDLNEFKRTPRHKQTHPKGFEPGIQWDGTQGTITATLSEEPDDAIWAELISDWGLDPSRTMVVDGSLQIRAWDVNAGNGDIQRLRYYKATIAPRIATIDKADIEALCKEVMKRKPSKPVEHTKGNTFLVLLSDWQLGKGEGGGTPATTERILNAIGASVNRYKELVKSGRNISQIAIIGLGDLVESCNGHYEMQTFQADLSDREQDKLARRLILNAIDSFVDFGVPIIAMGVPGNHGENRRNGKAFTDWTDNRDYSAFETVAEILSANPERYGHVSIPIGALNDDDLTMTLDLGVPVAFAHGHQFRSGTNSQAKLEGWWKGQALGRTQVADAEILFSGHLHHFVVSESTGRTVIQVPAMDGGSKWFTASSGSSSPSGIVTILIGESVGVRGWSDLLIV